MSAVAPTTIVIDFQCQTYDLWRFHWVELRGLAERAGRLETFTDDGTGAERPTLTGGPWTNHMGKEGQHPVDMVRYYWVLRSIGVVRGWLWDEGVGDDPADLDASLLMDVL